MDILSGGGWLSAARIKVTPEQLAEKANELNTKLTRIQGKFDSLERNVNVTKSYWIGEANDSYREKYAEFKPGVQEIIKRLEEHVRDLNAMAGVYQQAEEAANDIIEELPDNVIV